jgi:hypothetical protein
MTLVVGFRFADEVIIGADSRRIEQNGGAQHDDTEKVFDCTFGIIAAAGELNTIQAVVGTITVFEATPIDALGPTLLQIAPDPNDPARLLTQWLVSSLAAVGDGNEVNLSLITSGNNLQPVAIADGDYEVLYPDGMTQAQKTTVETALTASLADAVAAAEAEERPEIILDAIHAAIATVAGHNTGLGANPNWHP